MFELTRTINRWRQSFGAELRPEDLDELEEHLRSEVTVLTARELSEEEAFLVARRRLGGKAELADEFSKVHVKSRWMARVRWMVLGFLGINAVLAAVGLILRTGI